MRLLLLLLSICVIQFQSFAQTVSDFIVIDQFGYRPSAKKVAVLRDPAIGFDANLSFTPSNSYAVVDVSNNQQVYTGAPVIWQAGKIDSMAGDKAWWFDFSSVTTPGTYYILDITQNLKSYNFEIKEDVYNAVLKQAVRTFFYQRAGCNKHLPFAEAGWVDNASHVGSLQDKNCRRYNAKTNASTEKDLHGGWYDAGDYNKYTSWTGSYIIEMLKSYEENPTAWTDDYNIPESGNGIPDILDEAKWGMDYLLRLQEDTGSLISIVGLSHASPPSAAKGQSVYGGVNTSATLKGAAAFAYGAKIFRKAGFACYADSLDKAARKAWAWAELNPSVKWFNQPNNIGGGEMEINDNYDVTMFKLEAAVHMFDLTGEAKYKTYFDNNYTTSHLYEWWHTYAYEHAYQDAVMYYTTLPNATSSVVTTLKGRYKTGIDGANCLGAYNSKKDAYLTYLDSYTWGSNNIKSMQGLVLYEGVKYNVNASKNTDMMNAAEHYIHYIHGVNPLSKVYLSNMNTYGADNSVTEFYHSWFTDASAKWDKVGNSTYGPAPGFLVGGANKGYSLDSCCYKNSCGSTQNNALCSSLDVSKLVGQPAEKSYMDFNSNWPLNSWSVTENSCGYQISYIRLLSKFIKNNGAVLNGNTVCTVAGISNDALKSEITIYPNPTQTSFSVKSTLPFTATILDLDGKKVSSFKSTGNVTFGSELPNGEYLMKIETEKGVLVEKLIKR